MTAFESNVNWHSISGAVLEGFTSGGASTGRASSASPRVRAERQLAHLEVFEVDVSEGEGFPPPRDVVPLLLEAAP